MLSSQAFLALDAEPDVPPHISMDLFEEDTIF